MAGKNISKEIVITRIIDAPREAVFKAWTDQKQLAKWWGPHFFTNPVCKFEAKKGGAIQIHMTGPDGVAMPMTGIVEEIDPPKKLVFKTSAADGKLEGLNTVTFDDQKGKTKLTVKAVATFTQDLQGAADGMQIGWTQSLEKLAASVNDELLLVRMVQAPRDLVWKAWSEKDRLAKWWGPKGLTMMNVKLDFKPKGVFHYGMKGPDGKVMWGKFVYQEIVPKQKIVFVVSFSDEKGGITRHPMSASWPLEVLNTLTFEEFMGMTFMTLRGSPINATAEERKTFDLGRESMHKGFEGTWQQLDDYLKKVANDK